jgi:hypothetical protein
MGDGLQGVFHAHRPQGWAPTKRMSTEVCEGMRRVKILGTTPSSAKDNNVRANEPSHSCP